MYFEKFVVSLKSEGKFLRDENGVVKLPFGSEFSLYLKNLESRDAVVRISIDGKDVLDENRLMVCANSNLDLLGFMKNNKVKNNFKFIELTKDIEKHLGYTPEDSLIRIEVWFRKPKPIVQEVTVTYPRWGDYWVYPYYPFEPYKIVYTGNYTYSSNNPSPKGTTFSAQSCSNNISMDCLRSSTNDVGITVKGNECNQDFNSIYIDDLEEQSHIYILKLSGYQDNNKKVENIVATRDKIECETCGKENKYSNKFCSNCGTFLSK
jgi:hypothetical protein